MARQRHLSIALLLGSLIASNASAQTVTVSLHHDDPDGIVQVGETVTWTMWIEIAGFGFGSVASSINAAIAAPNPSLVTSSDMFYNDQNNILAGVGANGGYDGGDSDGVGGISFVNFTNSLFIDAWSPLPIDRSNPFKIGTFDIAATGLGVLNYSIITGPSMSAFVTVDLTAFSSTTLDIEEVAFDIDTLTIVPAPASALLLGAAGLLAPRRRR